MNSMFGDCKSLQKLDLHNFKTSNVKDMEKMFYNCHSLTSLEIKNFETNNVIKMSYMFSQCSSLNELNLLCSKDAHHQKNYILIILILIM